MTVRDLKKWLNNFPNNAIVEIAIQEDCGEVEFKEIELENKEIGEGWEYIDFTNNPWIEKCDKRYNKKILKFGEKQ